MTGMPAALAFATEGRTSFGSCARTMRTFAPFEIIVSMSVACCSLLRLASASMYLPPAASTVFWMFGLSCAAHRGCWKLFHDTPTVHPAPPEPAAAALAPPLAAAPLAPALAPPLAPPLLEHAARPIAATATSAPNLRVIICVCPPQVSIRDREGSAGTALGYHPPLTTFYCWCVHLPRTHPPGRIGQERFHGKLRRAQKGRLDTELRGDDPDEPAGRRKPPPVELGLDDLRHERVDPAEQSAE